MKKLSPIEEIRQRLAVRKKLEIRKEEIAPETMPDSFNKIYLVYKKHIGLKHKVMRLDNGVICFDCDLKIII